MLRADRAEAYDRQQLLAGIIAAGSTAVSMVLANQPKAFSVRKAAGGSF
jgi:hypothetical protein